MKELANRLAMQHLVNAYSQETGKASLFEKYQQNSTQLAFSQGLTLLFLPLSLIQAQLFVPLSYVSRVGRHRIAALPQIFQKGQKLNFSAAAMVSLLLEELVQQSEGHVDAASLVERWIQSRDALQQFLNIRAEDFDALVQAKQSFIESEQALILGHSMHPAPKSRTGFVHEDWQKYSPEACGQTQLHYWLVASEYVAEGTALEQAFSEQLKQEIKWHLSESELETLAAYAHYKLLPLHPWQARYLQSKAWFKSLKAKLKIIDLGEKAWIFSPTTSVRTLASFNAPWMLKPSLSVMITNSIRVNLAKECHRGEMTHRLWHSELGQSILKQCPTLKAVNDPAWIALQLDGEIIDETICIVAIIQAIVAKLYRLNMANTSFNVYRLALIKENKFRAARYGVQGNMIDFGLQKEVPTKELILELLDFIDDVVDELGSRNEINYVHTILKEGTGAAKQLAIFEETQDLTKVVDFITSEFTKGI